MRAGSAVLANVVRDVTSEPAANETRAAAIMYAWRFHRPASPFLEVSLALIGVCLIWVFQEVSPGDADTIDGTSWISLQSGRCRSVKPENRWAIMLSLRHGVWARSEYGKHAGFHGQE